MNKEVCFFINGNTLFLDKVLVSFNDTPIFFVCCDNSNDYYIVLCTNVEDLEYIIIKSSLHALYQMLSKKIEMRALFTNASHFWNVKAGDTWESDEVQYLERGQMVTDDLPYPNAYYEARKREDTVYVEQIAAAYFAQDKFSAIEAKTDIDKAVSTLIGISLDFAQEFDPYIDCVPIPMSPFTRKTKVFEASNMGNIMLAYKENKTWDAHISIGTNKTNKVPTETDCLAA